ncbi:unnamed protein product [Mortierella alpina]
MTPQHCSRLQRLFVLGDLNPIRAWISLLLSCCCEFWLTTIAAFTSLTPALEPLEALLPLNYPLNMQDRDASAKDLLAIRALPTFARARYARSRALLQSCAMRSMRRSNPCSPAIFEQAPPPSTLARSFIATKSQRNTVPSPPDNIDVYVHPSRSQTSSIKNKSRFAGRTTSVSGQQPQHHQQPTSIRHMAFYGLPLEIIQHIALFLPFHDLVKVFKSLPAIHRPIFQQQLDHSLALLMLTLELHQSPADVPLFRSASINPWEAALASESTLLNTRWRVTDFDSERMWVVFELEEKLGLEAAERRRCEIVHQQMSLKSSSSSSSSSLHALLGSPLICEQATQSVQDPTFDPALEASSSSRAVSLRFKRPREHEEDLETRIWRARRNVATASRRASPEPFQGTDGTGLEVEDLPDSNFFHCNGSPTAPALRSATVSFKAHRNVPAPWLSKYGSSFSVQEEDRNRLQSAPMPRESAWTARARERIAGYQQNRTLLRSLAKMRAIEDSQRAQFLPTAIELDARELGLKRVEAVVLDQNLSSDPDHCQGRPHFEPSRQARKSRRRSWHQLALTEDATVLPSIADDDEQPMRRFSSVFKRMLKAPSWSDPLSALSPPEQQPLTRWSIDGSGTVDWSTIISDMALSMYRSSVPSGRQGSRRPTQPCVVVRALPAREAEFSMHCSPVESNGHLKGTTDAEEEATLSQGKEVKERQLFELTYDIRHNYLHTSRLEGERVIRPMRFACSLDFFLHNSALTNSSKQ